MADVSLGLFEDDSDEQAFQTWYKDKAQEQGLNPDPDDPRHFYDYRAAHRAGATPDSTGHWPSEFKQEGHPRMVVDGKNTKTGEDVSMGLFDDDVSMGLFKEEPKPAVGEEKFYAVPRDDSYTRQLREKHGTTVQPQEQYPAFKDTSLSFSAEQRRTPEQIGDEAMRDMEDPLTDASPTAAKSAAAFGYGAAAFIPSGLAGTVMGLFKETPAEDRELDIPGLPDVGGKIEYDPDLKRAAEWVETIGGKVPAMIMEGDEQAIENVERVMGPLNKAWRYWGDTVEKTYLNQMESGEVPYDRQKAADMGALTATVLEGGFWILGPKFLKDMKVKIKEGKLAELDAALKEYDAEMLRVETEVKKSKLQEEAKLRQEQYDASKIGQPLLRPEDTAAKIKEVAGRKEVPAVKQPGEVEYIVPEKQIETRPPSKLSVEQFREELIIDEMREANAGRTTARKKVDSVIHKAEKKIELDEKQGLWPAQQIKDAGLTVEEFRQELILDEMREGFSKERPTRPTVPAERQPAEAEYVPEKKGVTDWKDVAPERKTPDVGMGLFEPVDTATKIVETAGKKQVPAEIQKTKSRDERFDALADAQRGKPESAMHKATMKMGGGVMQETLEHAGDIIHRMAQKPWHGQGYFTNVKAKVNLVHRRLHNEYKFEKEFKENIKDNAEFTNKDPIKFQKEVDKLLLVHAKEHGKLPAYNTVQRLANELNVALGEQRWDTARSLIAELKKHTDKGREHWEKVALEDNTIKPHRTKKKQLTWKDIPTEERTLETGTLKQLTPEDTKGIETKLPARRTVKDIFKDINTVTGERGSISMSTKHLNPEQLKAYERLSKDARKIWKVAAEKGRTIERYLLDQGHDPRVAYAMHRNAEELMRRPKVADKKKAEFDTKIKMAKKDAVPMTNEEFVAQWESAPKSYATARDKYRSTVQEAMELGRSPIDVFARDKGEAKAGPKIYRTADVAEQNVTKFTWEHQSREIAATKGIKAGSLNDGLVAKALDGKMDPKKLTRKLRKAYNFYKGEYLFYLDRATKALTETPESYRKVMSLVNKDKVTSADLKDLTVNERQAYSLQKSAISDYFPHVFSSDALKGKLKIEQTYYTDKLKLETKPKAIKRYKTRLKAIEDSLSKLNKGELITFKAMPKEIKMRFFKDRKGFEGYEWSAKKAYQVYTRALAEKIYYEPMLKEVGRLHKLLDPELKNYNIKFIRNFMGYDRPALSHLTQAIVGFQWMRTMGLNPRSAIVNFTQRLNTVADVGIKYSTLGEKYAFTKEGKELFDKTGIAQEVPEAIFEGDLKAEWFKLIKLYGGWMFRQMEVGNRRHAYLSATLKGRDGKLSVIEAKNYGIKDRKNLTPEEIHRYAVEIVHKTQFRYGKVGMPLGLQTATGRVAFQFWSFPIKQLELMNKWARTNPLKLVKYLAMAEGGNLLMQEYADMDLSNALGLGVTLPEIINAFAAVSQGDFKKALREVKVGFKRGSGIRPTSLGPTVTSAYEIATSIRRGKFLKTIKKELMFVQYNRFKKAYKGIINRQDKAFPMYDTNDHLMFYVTPRQLVQQLGGPASASVGSMFQDSERSRLIRQEFKQNSEEIVDAIVDGNTGKAFKLMNKYGIVPTSESIKNEYLRRNLTRETRDLMEGQTKLKQYEQRRK